MPGAYEPPKVAKELETCAAYLVYHNPNQSSRSFYIRKVNLAIGSRI